MRYEIKVNYTVEIEDKAFQYAFKEAQRLGYNYGDAGPIETLKRYLIEDGLCNVFPEQDVDRNSVIAIVQDEKA